MQNIENYYLQRKNIEYLNNTYGRELWVQVSGKKVLNDSDAGFWAGLVNLNDLEEVCSNHSWDALIGTQSPGFVIYGNNNAKYERISSLGLYCEHIVNYREFYGIKPNYVEIVEEFRLLNNLYHDIKNNVFYSIKDNGESEEVAKIKNNTDAFIKLKYLIKYATAKRMALLLFFDISTKIPGSLKENNLKKFSDSFVDDNIVYSIWGDEMPVGNYVYSILMGKKLIKPKRVEDCGYWPYEAETEYLDFIIGNDEYGDNITYTSDPNQLSNYFGKNPEAPHYLTPVFFKKNVLEKYISRPDIYSVDDGYLRCGGLWGLRMDNHHKESVIVYLGDLGSELPQEEQRHWKNYNVVPDGKLSDTKFIRDFLGCCANAEISDLKFKSDFSIFQKEWYQKFNWHLFLPFSDEDKYNFEQIHLPVNNTQTEFDQLVLSLVKTIIDSINEKEITKRLKDKNDKKSEIELKAGISKMERWFEESGLIDYNIHITFLRDLQGLRSSGTGHRKGTKYDKISKKFGLYENTFIDVFDVILQKANLFLKFLTENYLS